MNRSENSKSNCFLVLLAMLLLVGLLAPLTINAAETKKIAGISSGQTLYTQFSLFYEKNRYLTTNYRKGTLLPVNTKVKFVGANAKNIIVTLPDGEELRVKNIQRHSGEAIDGIFMRTFAVKPVKLSYFNRVDRQAMLAGKVRQGMSKAAVIIALGYPPKHKTPSLKMNQWKYWQSRFDTFTVYFKNDRVVGVQD